VRDDEKLAARDISDVRGLAIELENLSSVAVRADVKDPAAADVGND
jgi:hypothetical protein